MNGEMFMSWNVYSETNQEKVAVERLKERLAKRRVA
jgi:hypothetical protein